MCMHHPELALKCFKSALPTFMEQGSQLEIAGLYCGIACSHHMRRDFPEALKWYSRALGSLDDSLSGHKSLKGKIFGELSLPLSVEACVGA